MGCIASTYLRLTALLAASAVTVIVADSQVIQARYRAGYGAHAHFLPSGANPVSSAGTGTLERFGRRTRGYILWVGRLEPEAHVEELIRVFAAMDDRGYRLLIVGDSPHAGGYRASLEALTPPRGAAVRRTSVRGAYRGLGSLPSHTSRRRRRRTIPALLDQMAASGRSRCVARRPT